MLSETQRIYLADIIKKLRSNDPYMKKDRSCDCSYVTETEIYLHHLVLDSDILGCVYIGSALDLLFDTLDMYDRTWKITLDYSCFCIVDFPKNLNKFTELNYLFIDIMRDQIPDTAQEHPIISKKLSTHWIW